MTFKQVTSGLSRPPPPAGMPGFTLSSDVGLMIMSGKVHRANAEQVAAVARRMPWVGGMGGVCTDETEKKVNLAHKVSTC